MDDAKQRLEEQVTKLLEVGLTPDEAFLVAARRIGEADERRPADRFETLVVFGLAATAAIAVKIPELIGYSILDDGHEFYARNLSFFVLPLLAGYFGWKRGLDRVSGFWITLSFVVAAFLANVFPFAPGGATVILTAIHLPIALWLAVGIAYVGGVLSHFGTIGGGGENTIGGGGFDKSFSEFATIGGGHLNIARGDNTTVGGGARNRASAAGATVPGGQGNIASSVQTFAAGFKSEAKHGGTFVWSDISDVDAGMVSTGFKRRSHRCHPGTLPTSAGASGRECTNAGRDGRGRGGDGVAIDLVRLTSI